MTKRFFNGEELTEETILKTRKWFSDNKYACIDKVKTGEHKIYCDKEEYYKREEQSAMDYLDGLNDHVFTFLQRAYFIQTGKCIALLPN